MTRRHRKHSNPFSFPDEIEIPQWSQHLLPDAALHVDIGFGKGSFLLGLAKANPTINYIGLEIREHLTDNILKQRQLMNLPNVYAITCNVNKHLAQLFKPGQIETFYINFPDPWFKKRHHKRRVLNEELRETIEHQLCNHGYLKIATDNHDIALAMQDVVNHSKKLQNLYNGFAPADISFGPVPTERELWHTSQGHPIYKLILQRIAKK